MSESNKIVEIINEEIFLLNEVRYIQPNDLKNNIPLRDDESIVVYHGFNKKEDALLAAKFGISGKEKAKRIYSYESGNNPYGLFVTIDFETAKKFAYGGVIVEFTTKVANLEAPVWVGGRSYFTQGELTKSFKDSDERQQQQLLNREKHIQSEYPAITNSDRPELAYSLYENPERQALFVGDLNPNMIRRFWVAEKRTIDSGWNKMSRTEFLNKFYDEEKIKTGGRQDSFYDKKDKLFSPAEDFNLNKLKERLKNWDYSYDEFLKDFIYDEFGRENHLKMFFYPKQLEQIKNHFNLNEDFTKINKNNIQDELNNYVFRDENIGYHNNQYDNRLLMYDKENNLLAKVYYSIYEGEISITFIESVVKGKGYGKIAMIYLANEYGYENLERTSLTDDGAKMRKDLDNFYDFDYRKHKESKSKHLNPEIINQIRINHPVVADFMRDMVGYGYEKTWEKWINYLSNNNLINKYDFNDISEITTWIQGSVTNDNPIDYDPPQFIYDDLNKLIQNNDLNEIINEELISLTEARDSKNRSKARNYLRSVGYNDSQVKQIEEGLMNDLSPFIRDSEFKFLLGTARFYHEKKLRTGDSIRKLKELIKLINDSHLEEYDNNFNNEDFETLYKKFETAIQQDFEKDQKELAQKQFTGKSDYKVVPIKSYEEAKPYNQYTNWCVTQGEDAYSSYTSNGLGMFYFLLKQGFEQVPYEQGENAPKDEYGLSMIAVSVDEFGKLNSSTTRWNHQCGGTDNMFTTQEISDLIGQNFYQVLKPRYTREKMIQKIIDDGEKFTYLNITFIYYNKKYYLLDENGNILLNNHYDEIKTMSNNKFIKIYRRNYGTKLMNVENGEMVIDDWCGDIYDTNNPNRYIVIKYDSAVEKIQNVIDINTGKLLLNNWYYEIYYDIKTTVDNLFIVRNIENKFNVVNTDTGDEVLSDWLDNQPTISDNSLIRITVNNKRFGQKSNFVDINGHEVFDKYYSVLNSFSNGFAVVGVFDKDFGDYKYNYLDKNNKYLSDIWFDEAHNFISHTHPYALVIKYENGKNLNTINQKGDFLFKNWISVDNAFGDTDGYIAIERKGKLNILDMYGRYVSNIWFDEIWFNKTINSKWSNENIFREGEGMYGIGIVLVKINGKLYILTKKGQLFINADDMEKGIEASITTKTNEIKNIIKEELIKIVGINLKLF
ncbi:MAG: hypothetical protein ACOC22_00915 [bacterium]